MCVILVKKEGASVDEQTFRQCWAANSHGFGMAFIRKGRVNIEKGHQDVDKAWKAFLRAEEEASGGPMLLHFRIRSRGAQTKENCHPFSIKGGALVHNGTFHSLGTTDGPSDTAELCATFGDKLDKKNLTECKDKVEKAIGSWNLIATLYNDGSTLILNEPKGTWKDNVWFSNMYWKRGQTFTGSAQALRNSNLA